MRHATRVLSLAVMAGSVALLAGSRAEAQCTRGGSYTATGRALMAYDPPSYFIGGFAQTYQAPAAQTYSTAATRAHYTAPAPTYSSGVVPATYTVPATTNPPTAAYYTYPQQVTAYPQPNLMPRPAQWFRRTR